MKRRDFLSGSAALAAGALAPPIARSQQRVARFCDMHAHLGLRTPSVIE